MPIIFSANGTNKQSGHLDTYLDHFLLCARNPTLQQDQTAMGQPCMSKGGIPVQPFFALGGFPDKEYRGKLKLGDLADLAELADLADHSSPNCLILRKIYAKR